MPEKSFLGSVKDEIGEVFAGVYDELAEICSDNEQLAAALKKTHKGVWEIVEKKLKESYRNGQQAKGNGKSRAAAVADPEAPSNPFRK